MNPKLLIALTVILALAQVDAQVDGQGINKF